MSAKVAFIGLGVMGYPMAGHLSAAGYRVTVFNRTPARAKAWCSEYAGEAAATPAAAAAGAEFVLSCVGDDNDVRDVLLGQDGALQGADPGATFVDHTTASAGLAKELSACAAQRECEFIDAPVSGGQVGAEKGILTVMAGGDEAVFDRCMPLLETYARTARLLGGVGSGQLAKMVNQICIAGVVEGLAEGIHFAQCAGLDGQAVMEVLGGGAAQSWQMDNRAGTMLEDEYDFGFAVGWMRKDLNIALATARELGARLPLTALVDQLYAEVEALGGKRWDTSSLLRRLQTKSQTTIER